MVLHAHFKKHIIALGGWLLMYTSGPPRPRFGKKPSFFRIFFCYLPLAIVHHLWCISCGASAVVHQPWCISSGASALVILVNLVNMVILVNLMIMVSMVILVNMAILVNLLILMN